MAHVITVNSDGTVSPTTLNIDSGHGDATITFQGATGVTFQVSGLDSSQFNPTSSGSGVSSFTTTDKNTNSTKYSYSVSVTGRTAPTTNGRIQNGSPN